MKKKALIIFGWEFRWESEFISALEVQFEVEKMYFFPELRKLSYKEIINSINDRVRSESIDAVLFNIDFISNIDYIFINSIDVPTKVAFTHDDPSLHLRNSITCLLSHINVVIVSDALSLLKYRALGFEAVFLPLEGSDKYYDSGTIKQRPIDVLFIGQTEKADRLQILNKLIELGVSVRIEGGSASNLGYIEMIRLYQSAKIVLNFSKNDVAGNASTEMGLYGYLLEGKGRVYEAGLCGALCVSEYAPLFDIFFAGDLVPTFRSSDQCAKIVKELLSAPEILESKRKAFAMRCEQLRPTNLVKDWKLEYRSTTNWIRAIPDWYLVWSFFERFRWALLCRRPADFLAYSGELFALPISVRQKFTVLFKAHIKIFNVLFKKFLRKIASR